MGDCEKVNECLKDHSHTTTHPTACVGKPVLAPWELRPSLNSLVFPGFLFASSKDYTCLHR